MEGVVTGLSEMTICKVTKCIILPYLHFYMKCCFCVLLLLSGCST